MPSHILVIDDQINLPRFIEMELQAAGYQVSLSCDDQSGLSIVRTGKPDLIVLNWELRCASGLHLYRWLRLIDEQVPVVIITAEDEENSRRLASEPGTQVCLTKPFSMSDLLKIIKSQLKLEKQGVNYSICD
jgi:DNA-binding response OmpR family regulator